jgi:rare lipoprotein A (peptidoglycan hydrolase)
MHTNHGPPYILTLCLVTLFSSASCLVSSILYGAIESEKVKANGIDKSYYGEVIAWINDRKAYSKKNGKAIRQLDMLEKEVVESEVKVVFEEKGTASWYGVKHHGKLTANGEICDMNELTAAHKYLPFNTLARVTNLKNGKNVIARINDRGPFVKDRIIDLSKEAARRINMIYSGTSKVKLEILTLDN